MNYLILILLGLLFILVLLRIFQIEEGFQVVQLKQSTIDDYTRFKEFYNTFMKNWEKAIISSAVGDTEQEPLNDPSQVTAGQAKKPSRNDINAYIVALAKGINKPLPPLTDLAPEQINITNLASLAQGIPQDPTSFINALMWMNSKLEESQAELGSALQGGGGGAESFQNKCDDITNCIANNPELLNKIAQASAPQDPQRVAALEQMVSVNIQKLLTPTLNTLLKRNQQLMKQAEAIQQRAQSGQMVNDINVPGGRTKGTYQKSPDDESMKNLQKNDPKKYNQLKNSNSQWFAVKSLIEQINSTF